MGQGGLLRRNLGRRGGATLPATPFPLTLSPAPVLWSNYALADVNTEGTNVTTIGDKSVQHNTITRAGAGNSAIYHTQDWGLSLNAPGLASLEFKGSQTNFDSVAASLLNVANGTNPAFTVFFVGQMTNTQGSPIFEFQNAAFTNFKLADFSGTTLKWRMQDRAAGVTSTPTSTFYLWPYPAVLIMIRDPAGGNRWRVSRNGQAFQSLAFTDTGAGAALSNFRVWGNTSVNNVGDCKFRDLLVYPAAMAEATALLVGQYLASQVGLGWNKNFGGSSSGGGALIIPMAGQSNMAGRGLTLKSFPDARCFMMHRSGHLKTAFEPTDDHTGGVTGSDDGSGQQGCSLAFAVAAQLRARGETRDLIFVPRSRSGSLSSDWNNGIALDPLNMSGAFGQFAYAVVEAAQNYPNARIAPMMVWQGEGDATTGATPGAAWQTNWAAVVAQYITTVGTTFGCTFDKTCPAIFVNLSPTTPNPGVSYPGWADMRTKIAGIGAVIANALVVSSGNGPWNASDNLHFDTGANDTEGLWNVGKLLGNAIFDSV